MAIGFLLPGGDGAGSSSEDVEMAFCGILRASRGLTVDPKIAESSGPPQHREKL